MKVLVFFLVVLALGSANPIGSATSEPTREDRIKTAIDKNVQWLLRSIEKGNLKNSDLARAVVAVFLAKPEYFSVGHGIGQLLKIFVAVHFFPRVTSQGGPTYLPTEELALYVQALTVSCYNVRRPLRSFSHDLTKTLWDSGIRSQRTGRFPSNAFLALCNAHATHRLVDLPSTTPFEYVHLTDEEALTTMAIDCFQSRFPWNLPSMQYFIEQSGYQYYPSNLTVEKLEGMMNPDDGSSTSLSAIAATMQTLMHIRRLGVSDLPSVAVDFLLDSQDEDGSWGQSALNSFFVLPVLSNKSFLNISKSHCPPIPREEEPTVSREPRPYGAVRYNDIRSVYYVGDDDPILSRNYSNSLYDLLSRDGRAVYQNGTDGKPYLTSLFNQENSPEGDYFWKTYEIAQTPNGTWTRLTQSHADIEVKRGYKFVFWFTWREWENLS